MPNHPERSQAWARSQNHHAIFLPIPSKRGVIFLLPVGPARLECIMGSKRLQVRQRLQERQQLEDNACLIAREEGKDC